MRHDDESAMRILFVFVCCYLTQLSYPGDGGLASVLSVHGVLLEKQEDLVVFRVVTFWDQVNTYEPGVWRKKRKRMKHRNQRRTQGNTHTFVHTHTHPHTNVFFTIQPLPQWQSPHPYFTPPKPIPRDILQSRLSNNSHSLYTLLLQYLTLPRVSALSPNPT